jgi:hypothetical protein
MNVEIGTEAAQFPVKEYKKRDFPCSGGLSSVAVFPSLPLLSCGGCHPLRNQMRMGDTICMAIYSLPPLQPSKTL